jgi:hypothetical protein
MSKRDLKKYVSELTKDQLELQFLELYDKFSDVKTYFDFVFRPNEKNLLKEAKLKISNEFYPLTSRKPKLRRSTSQKIIKHYINLGVDPFIVADIMLYTIEIAQSYTDEKSINQESFYKSMLNSYEQAIVFCVEKGMIDDFKNRAELILIETTTQKWPNAYQFQTVAERYFY